MGETFSIVPTSAITYDFQTVGTISSYKLFQSFLLFLASCLIYCVCDYFSGEGIPDLLLLLVQWTQKTMVEKLTFSNEVQVRFPQFFVHVLNITQIQMVKPANSNWVLIFYFFSSVPYWRSRLLKAMGQPLMLCWSMECCMKEIRQLSVACK